MESNQQAQPTYQEIAADAYLIWMKEGRPHGREMAHLLQAEQHLLANCSRDKKTLIHRKPELIQSLTATHKVRPRGFGPAPVSLQEV
ncbi:MAG: DUF2934 domain-containing protein [Verrucomicrobiia bacterium]